jgi:hypothetical protein
MNKKGGVLVLLGIIFFVLSGGFSSHKARALSSGVIINEIAWMGTELSANDEWIELYNMSDSAVDLAGYRLVAQDGSPQISLEGIIAAYAYYLLERTDDESVGGIEADIIFTGSLGNSGEVLELLNAQGEVVDSVEAVEVWPAGDNISKQTMSRKADGSWLSSQKSGGTPKAENDFSLVTLEETSVNNGVSQNNSDGAINNTTQTQDDEPAPTVLSPTTTSASGNSEKIIISEIFPNPKGSDEGEFIELYNAGTKAVDLFEWQIADDSGYRYRFKEKLLIKPKEFLLLWRSDVGLAMNNNGDTIALYKQNKKAAVDTINYLQANEGLSLVCLDDNFTLLNSAANVECLWSRTPTPGLANIVSLPNRAPVVDFSFSGPLFAGEPVYFDGSDTIDYDNDGLWFFWNFGDSFTSNLLMPDHIFAEAGEYTVLLQVFDGEFEAEIERKIKILGFNTEAVIAEDVPLNMEEEPNEIRLSRLLPNPVGDDGENEWIEIVNRGETKVNLLNWRLDDEEGGSKPYAFPSPLYLNSLEAYTVRRNESGLALNNDRDSVRIFSPLGHLIDSVDYEKAKEGDIYIRGDDGKWSWSLGQAVKPVSASIAANLTKKEAISLATGLKIADLQAEHIGRSIKVSGVVTVLPGVFGSQYFYILEDGAGLQIYSYNKYFPELKVGDLLEVSGEVSQVGGEYRVKTKNISDIKKISTGAEPKPQIAAPDQLSDLQIGSLVELRGIVVKKQSASIYLDDGQSEALIYIKSSTGIKTTEIKVDTELSVRGLVLSGADGRRLLPRSQSDLVIVGDNNTGEAGSVMGEAEDGETEWTLAARNSTRRAAYIKMTMLAILIGGFVILIKRKKPKLENKGE